MMRSSVAFYLQTLGIHHCQDRAVLIRTQYFRAAVHVTLHDFLFRMAETVEIADCEHGISGLYGIDEVIGG